MSISTVLVLRINDNDDLYKLAFKVDVAERRSPGTPQSDMPSDEAVSLTSKSNLNLPNCLGVTSIPF